MPKLKKYYADRVSKCTVMIPKFKIGKDGEFEPVIRQDKYGREMINKSGVSEQVMQRIEFQPVVGNVNLGTYCIYETKCPIEQKGLDTLVVDSSTHVCLESTFKKRRNLKAYELEEKLKEAKGKLVDETIKSENLELKNAENVKNIEAYKKEIEKLKGK